MNITLSFDERKIVVEGVKNFEEAEQFVKEVLGDCEFKKIEFQDGISEFLVCSNDKEDDKMKKLYEEFPNVITCKFLFTKPEGRFRPFFRTDIKMDEAFREKYNASVGNWGMVPYFKDYYFVEVESYYRDGCREDFYERLGFQLYENKFPGRKDYQDLHMALVVEHDPHSLIFKGYLPYKENIKGVEDYQVELDIIMAIAKSAKETVLKNCLEAYMSPEIKIEKEI